MITKWIKKALTTIEYRSRGRAKKLERIEVPPSEREIYAIYFCFLALTLLTIIEILHIICLGTFSTDIFSAITGLIGTVTGVFISKR